MTTDIVPAEPRHDDNRRPDTDDGIEGLERNDASWGDYPIDELLIRNETRTIDSVVRRIKQENYVLNPDFQRDFIWSQDKQSKLIESVIMRVPLPVFYMAENDEGKMVVVDGLQRLSTFRSFLGDELKLSLPKREELHNKRFSDISPKFQNRIEDSNLIFYIIDSKVPEQARMDIFERVNGGVPLTRQQMRNRHAFRKHTPGQTYRNVLNAALWDVMSTGLSHYGEDHVIGRANRFLERIHNLLDDKDFKTAITYSTNSTSAVKCRFEMAQGVFEEVLGAYAD